MPLPYFGPEGLLPEGIHTADEVDIQQRLVDEFESSSTRHLLLAGLCQYRSELCSMGLRGEQWIDGSFVDQLRVDPEDIDLVNFCDQILLNRLEPDEQRRASILLGSSRETIETYKCHTFVVVKYPDDHPMAEGYEERRRYWRDWFSTPQEYSLTSKCPAPSRGRKGFVRMELDSSGDNP